MNQPDTLNLVADFHRMFKSPILETPSIPGKRSTLRIDLIQEELNELNDAVAGNNIVGVADALCDLQYVLSGAILEFGLGDKFKALFEEVHRSNMSKACNTKEEAQATVEDYRNKGSDSYYQMVDDKYLVYRKSDHKTLKSIAYSKAKLEELLK